MSIRGWLDLITTKEAAGWAYQPGRKEGVMVQAVLSHEIVGDALAADHRADLAAVGLGNGNCGYTITFYREIDPLYLPFVGIKVDAGDIELPRASHAGFAEFFTALYRLHPAAGRPRSVLGGLWIDRTDAAALLKDKTDIGQIDPVTARVISQLIHAGIAIVPLSDTALASGEARGKISSELVGATLESPPLLTALRTVYDANPLALTAEAVIGHDIRFVQPSAENTLPSPAECLAIVALIGGSGELAIEIVRDSHLLPEFTPGGVSRWGRGGALAGFELATAQNSLLTRYELGTNTAAIIGPGTLYRLKGNGGGDALKLLTAPSRSLPVTLARDRTESRRESGVRVCL